MKRKRITMLELNNQRLLVHRLGNKAKAYKNLTEKRLITIRDRVVGDVLASKCTVYPSLRGGIIGWVAYYHG